MSNENKSSKVFANAPRRLSADEIKKVSGAGGPARGVGSKQGGGQDNQVGQGFQ